MRQGWKDMMTYKRGDVILVRFPYSDLKTCKKRPALAEFQTKGTGLDNREFEIVRQGIK